MANVLQGGFTPRRTPAGCSPRRYEVASSYGTALFPGDVVTLVTAGTVESAAAGASVLILGVIAHVSYVSGGVRLYGPYIPATTVYSPTARGSANASYVYVWDDPAIEYIAAMDVATTAALNYAGVGSNVDLKVSDAGSTVYGRSAHKLDGTYVAGIAQFRILEMLREPGNDLTAQYQRVVCMINEGAHAFTSTAGL